MKFGYKSFEYQNRSNIKRILFSMQIYVFQTGIANKNKKFKKTGFKTKCANHLVLFKILEDLIVQQQVQINQH